MDEILNTRTEVSSSSPNVLNEGDFFRIYFELFSQPSVVEFYALVFEENELIGFVEDLNAYHNESRVMPSSKSNVVQIVEPKTELRADQGICWWVHFTCHAVGLETKYSCCNIVNIISPASNNWIAIDFSAGNSSSC